jgi:hypothetical protein
MLDQNIMQGARGLSMPDFYGQFQQGIQDNQANRLRQQQIMATTAQNQQNADNMVQQKAYEGILSKADFSTPEGQSAALQAAKGAGLGSKALEMQGSFSQMAGNEATAQEKKAQLQAQLRKNDEDLYNATSHRIATNSALLMHYTPEERPAIKAQMLQDLHEHNINPADWETAPTDDETLGEYSMITMKPEDKVKYRYDQGKKQIVKSILPHIDELATPPAGGWTNTTHAARMSEIMKTIPPDLRDDPNIKSTLENFRAQKPEPKGPANNNLATGSSVLIPGLTPIPGVQITKESVKNVKTGAQAYDTVKDQIKRMRDLYAQTGTEMGGEKARKLASMVRQIQLTLKGPEFLQLGVLAGPDMALLDEMVPNPTGFKDNIKSMIPGLGDPITPKLDELETFIDGRFQSALNRNGFQKAPETTGQSVTPKSDPLGLF